MSTTDKLRDKLITRACELLDKAENEEKLDAKLDIFKAVTAFYTAAIKVGGKDQSPGKGGGTFADIQRRLAGGATPVNGGSA
jgi:hypothetical protein